MRSGSVLINESQLGTRLNHAIEYERRGEFALLLALLSTDARDMAQFHTDSVDSDVNERLRAKFDLPQAERLLSDLSSEISPIDNSSNFRKGGMSAFYLAQAMQPEAIVIRGNQPTSMQKVLTNCDLITRQKFNDEKVLDKRVPHSVKLHTEQLHFVDQLSQQRQMSRLIEAC